MKERISHGRRPEFVGGGLIRSSGGWFQVLSWVNGVHEWRNFRGNYTRRPSASSESHWKKMIGKPYSGKPNVRFDEGELEIEPSATTPALYSTVTSNPLFKASFLESMILDHAGNMQYFDS